MLLRHLIRGLMCGHGFDLMHIYVRKCDSATVFLLKYCGILRQNKSTSGPYTFSIYLRRKLYKLTNG